MPELILGTIIYMFILIPKNLEFLILPTQFHPNHSRSVSKRHKPELPVTEISVFNEEHHI